MSRGDELGLRPGWGRFLPATELVDDYAFFDDDPPLQLPASGVLHALAMGEFAVRETELERSKRIEHSERARVRLERRVHAVERAREKKREQAARTLARKKERRAEQAARKLRCPTCNRLLQPEQLCPRCQPWSEPHSYSPLPAGPVLLRMQGRELHLDAVTYRQMEREAKANQTDVVLWSFFRAGRLG